MSTLTKILVVVMAVLAIFVTAVMIKYVNTTASYKSWGEGEQLAKQAALAQASLKESEKNAVIEQNKQLQLALSNAQTLASTDKTALQSQIATLQTNLTNQQNTNSQLLARLTDLQTSVEQMQTLGQKKDSDLQELRKNIQTLQTQLSQAEQQQKESELRVIYLERAEANASEQARDYERQIKDLENKLRDVAQGKPITVDTGSRGGDVLSPPRIDGSVTAVRDNIVGLNVGTADGVRQGMRFTIYRGSEYVGTVQVQDLDPNESAGILMDAQRQPMAGDKASTVLGR